MKRLNTWLRCYQVMGRLGKWRAWRFPAIKKWRAAAIQNREPAGNAAGGLKTSLSSALCGGSFKETKQRCKDTSANAARESRKDVCILSSPFQILQECSLIVELWDTSGLTCLTGSTQKVKRCHYRRGCGLFLKLPSGVHTWESGWKWRSRHLIIKPLSR